MSNGEQSQAGGYRKIPKAEMQPADTATDLAKAEAEALAQGKLEEHAKHREHRRTQRFRDSLNYVAVVAIWILAIAILAAVVAWFWHLLTPLSWHFLSDEQLRRIETVVFSGLLVGVVQRYLSKHV